MNPLQKQKAQKSAHKIGWLNLPGYKGETWNPIIGCSKVSEGCENCYAEKMAIRLANIKTTSYYQSVTQRHAYAYPEAWNGKTFFNKEVITKPAHWKKPRLVFVCSMGDLFHETATFEEINAVFSVMSDCDQHIYIVLTKRPERMFEFYKWKIQEHGVYWQPKDNVWIGTTAENQKEAKKRIPWLLAVNAAVHFVSIEPMLGPVNLTHLDAELNSTHSDMIFINSLTGRHTDMGRVCAPVNYLNWVIVGGESGHNARPMHPDWVRSVKDQCKTANVPFFFKQWGELLPKCQYTSFSKTVLVNPKQFPSPHNPDKMNTYYKVGKKHSGNLLDGNQYHEYPIFNNQ